jgi:hypothetical protein
MATCFERSESLLDVSRLRRLWAGLRELPRVDLVGAWHLLDDEPRCAFRAELGCDDLQWARGAAWAFEQAMGVVWYYVDSNAAMSAMGRRTLDRILRADLR